MSAKPAKASKKEPLTARDLDHATKDLDFGDVAAWPERTGSPMPAIKPVASAARKSIDTAAANEPNALLGPTARELTAKEANQLIREEAKAQKENDRVKARGEGAGVRVLQDAQKRHPNDPKKQVAYFMENFLGNLGTIRSDGAWYMPQPADTKMPLVATRDIARVAAEELRATWSGHRYRGIHGPEDLSMGEVADILTGVLERNVSFVSVPLEGALDGMRGAGVPEFVVSLYRGMLEGLGNGRMVPAEPSSAQTTTPTSFATFAREVLRPAFAS